MIWSEGLSFKSPPRYYNRRNSNVSPVVVAGVGLERLISTIPPNLPLIREACGKTLSCIALQFGRHHQSR